MPEEQAIVFPCRGDSLVGILHRPAQPVADLAVVTVVGGPQYRVGSHRQFVLTARCLADAGVAVFRFDYRGLGDSTGEPRDFLDIEADITAALDTVRELLPDVQIVLMGLCDAASAILMRCRIRMDTDAVVLINPWVRTEEGLARSYTQHYYRRRLLSWDLWRKLIAFRLNPFVALQGFIRNRKLARLELPDGTGGQGTPAFIDQMRSGLAARNIPALVLLSGQDLTAREFENLVQSDEHWRRLLDRPEVTMAKLPQADHTFSDRRQLDELNRRLLDWLLRLASTR